VPPTLADRVAHILESIEVIRQLLSGRTKESLGGDLFARLALERSFEIISEASRRIPEAIKAENSDIDWAGMAALGNRLRHAYHRIDIEILMKIAEHDLPPLQKFTEGVIRGARNR